MMPRPPLWTRSIDTEALSRPFFPYFHSGNSEWHISAKLAGDIQAGREALERGCHLGSIEQHTNWGQYTAIEGLHA